MLNPRRAKFRELAVAMLFLLLWLGPPFRGILSLETVNVQNDIFASDLLHDRLPCRAFVGDSLRRGELPVWTPGIYTGFPALAQIEVGALYPSNGILFGLFDPYTAVAWAQFLPLMIAGLGAFLLAREYDLPLPAALLSSGTFALSGFFVSHLRHLNMIDAACWIPFLVLSVERLHRGRGGIGALALVWAIQLLGGHPQISYFTACVLVALLLWRHAETLRDHGVLRAGPVARVLAGLALGTVLAAVQLVPTYELATLTYREGGLSFEQASGYPASPWNVLTFVLPYVNGDPGQGTYRLSGLFWEQYGYLGLLPFVLALVGVATGLRRDRTVRMYAAMAVIAWLLFLGPATPLFRWAWELVPGMDRFRFPTRFLVFVELALALLAGFGLRNVSGRFRSRPAGLALACAVLAITAGDLWYHQMRQVPQADRKAWTTPPETVRFLRRRLEASDQPWRYFSLEAAGLHRQAYVEAGGWSGDLTPYLRHRAMIQPSSNLLFGLESPDGYVNLVPRYYESVWGSEKRPGLVLPSGERRDGGWHLAPRLLRLLRLFNVRYLLSSWPIAGEGLEEVRVTDENVGIFEIDDPLPRAFVVSRVRSVATDEEGLALLRSGSFDPASEAIVRGGAPELPAESRPSRNVRIVERTNRTLRLEAHLRAPGLLVVSEGDYPGWQATVDGRPVPIYRTNVMMRGIVLDEGSHEVTMSFRSGPIRTGLAISLAGAFLLLLLWRTGRIR